MATINLAVEIGTSYTSIFVSGEGVVLRESTTIAYNGEGEKKKPIAYGNEAYKLIGKAPDKTVVVNPVRDGYIVEVEAMTDLMTEFIKRILPTSYVFYPKIKVLLAVPTGLEVEERKIYEEIMLKSGVAEVTLVDNVITTAHGLELPIDAPESALVVNMGSGVTEIALISLCGTITGCSISVAGAMLDRALMDFVTGKYGIKIGIATARRVREEIASLYVNDTSSMEVSGISINTLTPKTVRIYAIDTYEALMPYFARIAEAIKGNTNLCPPELAESLHENGVFIAGGLSKTPGLKEFFADIIELPVTVAPDGELTAIYGAGKLLEDKPLLNKIIAQQ